MKYGFIKTALCTPELKTGAVSRNVERIKECISAAAAKKAEIIIFGENAVTGFGLGSMANYSPVLSAAKDAVAEIAEFSKTLQSLIILGFPLRAEGKTTNAAALISGGKIYAVETEAFSDGTLEIGSQTVSVSNCKPYVLPNFSAAIEICFGERFDETCDITDRFGFNGAKMIIDVSAGENLIGSLKYRAEKAKYLSARLKCAYVYVSTFGEKAVAENDEILLCSDENETVAFAEIDLDAIEKAREFAGRESTVYDSLIEIPLKPKNTDITRRIDPLPFVPSGDEFPRILELMGNGIYSRMKAAGVKRVIFGLSGGLDSTMVAVACERLFTKRGLNKKDIIAVTMSGFGSSDRTKNNAGELIKALGVTNVDISIADAVTAHLKDIGHGGKKDVVYENAQARERAQILLDLSNARGALLLGTGDLSEIALGWSTYGGDQLAQFNPNSSATKTLIRAVMRNYCLTTANADAARIINDVLATPVSPELIAGQVTEDVLGPYELHDFYLYNFIFKGFSAEKTVYLAQKAFPDFTRKTIIKHLKTFAKRFFSNQFKRNASCDGVRLNRFDLSKLRISSEFSGEAFLQEIEKLSE